MLKINRFDDLEIFLVAAIHEAIWLRARFGHIFKSRIGMSSTASHGSDVLSLHLPMEVYIRSEGNIYNEGG
jgi:hypothetical protein